jgi:hypothetical protein
MTIQAAQDVSLGFIPGDHVCAFYSSSKNVLDDIVVDYITKGLQAGNVFIRNMETMAQEAADEGYGSFRAVGDESFLIRNDVDIKEWFAAESELNKIVPDFPHFFFCLYDLDLFDGDTVMYVLRTHPRVYVNGIIIGNLHYQAERLAG